MDKIKVQNLRNYQVILKSSDGNSVIIQPLATALVSKQYVEQYSKLDIKIVESKG